MAISLKHAFTSPKADGTDSTLVQPSNWNAEHTISLAAGKVLGRDSSGNGSAQELAISVDSTQQSMIPPFGTTAQRPASPAAGMMRYNTTTARFEGYSSSWGTLGGGCTISDTAPSSPVAGDLWWKSDEGQMYVYYTDANSSQWVIANAFAGGTAYLPLTGGTVSGATNFAAGVNLATSSGNVGIGTSSPSYPLDIVKSQVGLTTARLLNNNSAGYSQFSATTDTVNTNFGSTGSGVSGAVGYVQVSSNHPLTLWTSGLERLRIDTSGNVGIGVAPASSWNSAYKAIHIANQVASLSVNGGNAVDLNVSWNAYATGNNTWAYLSTGDVARQLQIATNGFHFKYAASGTAGNPITWTSGMLINGSGNVGIGTESPSDKLHVTGFIRSSGADATCASFATTGTAALTAVSNARYWRWLTSNGDSSFRVVDETAAAERMRIDSSGYMFINETATVGTASYLTITTAASSVYGATIKNSGTTYASTTRFMNFLNSSNAVAGSIQHTAATTTAFSTSSDARLKENIVDAPSAINILTSIPVRSYDWKEDGSHVEFGFVAQELEQVYAEPVGVGGDDVDANPWSIEYGRLTPILVKALQEANAKIEALIARVETLEKK